MIRYISLQIPLFSPNRVTEHCQVLVAFPNFNVTFAIQILRSFIRLRCIDIILVIQTFRSSFAQFWKCRSHSLVLNSLLARASRHFWFCGVIMLSNASGVTVKESTKELRRNGKRENESRSWKGNIYSRLVFRHSNDCSTLLAWVKHWTTSGWSLKLLNK